MTTPVAIAITGLVRRLGVDGARAQADELRRLNLPDAAAAIELAIDAVEQAQEYGDGE